MSISVAFLTAVRDAVREFLEYSDAECDITAPPGQPHPRAGKWFVAISDAATTATPGDPFLVRPTVNLTLSCIVADDPQDRLHHILFLNQDSLKNRQAAIVAMLTEQQDWIRMRVQELMNGHNGFAEAPMVLTVSEMQKSNPDWWGREVKHGHRNPYGYKSVVTYGGADVIQSVRNVSG